MLDALIDAAVVCRMQALTFSRCGLSHASVPALARVLRAGTLWFLDLDCDGELLLSAPVAALFAEAVAASRTLVQLHMVSVCLWHDPAAAATVMRALTGHPSLQDLTLGMDAPMNKAAAGVLVGGLISADAPALKSLSIDGLALGDLGLSPVAGALAYNQHLRELDCCTTSMSEAFAREVFLPAIRANTGLLKLEASSWWNDEEDGVAPPEVLEAEALVAARSR